MLLWDFSLCVLNIFSSYPPFRLTSSLKTQTPSLGMGDSKASVESRTPWGENKWARGHQARDDSGGNVSYYSGRKKEKISSRELNDCETRLKSLKM